MHGKKLPSIQKERAVGRRTDIYMGKYGRQEMTEQEIEEGNEEMDANRSCYHDRDPGRIGSAYVTVYLTLCLAVLLSLCLALIDGVRRNGARMEAECIADIGLYSIMAEYHRELLTQYNLFAIDSSYGTAQCGKANTASHLRKYITKNLSYEDILLSDFFYRDFLSLELKQAELTKGQILTDYGGTVFRRCAAEAVKDDVGLGLLQELREWTEVVEVNGLEEGKEEEKKQELDGKIGEWAEAYNGTEVETEEGEIETLEIANPTSALEAKKSLGILRLVIGEEDRLSQNRIQAGNLVMSRMERGQINRGNIECEELDDGGRLVEKFAFQEYLLRYMGRYGDEREGDALRYQIEYLVAGKESDVENLRSVANRLCLLREAANAMYLLSDTKKRQQIEFAAGLVCTLVMLPELTPLLEGAILLGWAYAESVYDVKSLLAGGKVPLLKDENSWHYSLGSALAGSLQDETQDGDGLDYKDYLRIFMMIADTDTLTARAMNMVEADIRETPGNAGFRLDGCYAVVEACVRIGSAYGYEYEIIRQSSYW